MDNKKINGTIRIPVSSEGINFFVYWLQCLSPFFHKMANKEINVAASFLKHRYQLSLVIADEELLDKVLMNDDTKRKIREECGITSSYFQVIMGKLRKASFIKDNKVNKKFIPKRFNMEEGSFRLLFYFEFDETDSKKSS